MKSLMMVLLFTYPLWGTLLVFFMAMILSATGPLAVRAVWAGAIGLLLMALFTPIMWGTEGFVMAVPLPWMLLDREHCHFHSNWAWITFLFAFGVNLFFGERKRSKLDDCR